MDGAGGGGGGGGNPQASSRQGNNNNNNDDRTGQFLQTELTPRQRKISSPYPLYNFKKPEDYHPSIDNSGNVGPPTYPPPAYPQESYPPEFRPQPSYPTGVYRARAYPAKDKPRDGDHPAARQRHPARGREPPRPRPEPSSDAQRRSKRGDRVRGSEPQRQVRPSRGQVGGESSSSFSPGKGRNGRRQHKEQEEEKKDTVAPHKPFQSNDDQLQGYQKQQEEVVEEEEKMEGRRDSAQSDLDLQHRHGSMTDDDKLNESEKEKDRRLDQEREEAPGMSDEEAERGLEILRQLHEQSEAAARRLEEEEEEKENEKEEEEVKEEGEGEGSDDVTDHAWNDEEKQSERGRERDGSDILRGMDADSGSLTPTNSETYPFAAPPLHHHYHHDLPRDARRYSEEDSGTTSTTTPQPPIPLSPVTLLPPADVDVYYSLSKRRYHVASSSEPSQSRQLSPGSTTGSFRAQSQLQGEFVPGPRDRYARRATRADVLSRAERLLDSRLRSRLEGPRYYDLRQEEEEGGAGARSDRGRNRGQKRQKAHQQQLQSIREASSGVKRQIERKFSDATPTVKRVAFVDVGDDDDDDDWVDARRGAGKGEALQTSSLPAKGREAGRRERDLRVWALGRGDNSHRLYSNSPTRRSSDVIHPVRGRTVLKPARSSPRKPGSITSSHDASAAIFSGSEDEVAVYGLRHPSDPARYQLTRGPPLPSLPLLPSLRPEGDHPSLATSHGVKKARRVWFFRNGDADFRARLVVVSKKLYPNMDTLLVALQDVIPIVAGVKQIFSLPEGRRIRSVRELQDSCYYVCSGLGRLVKNVKYGDVREQHWKGGKVTHDESHLFTVSRDLRRETQSPSQQVGGGGGGAGGGEGGGGVMVAGGGVGRGGGGGGGWPGGNRPWVITVISNLQRECQEKLILKPGTTMNYERLLEDLQIMIHIPRPPVTAMYTLATPHIMVEGFSHMFRKLKEHRHFLVCGTEGPPLEPSPRPSSSPTAPHKGKKAALRPSNRQVAEMRKAMAERMNQRRGHFRRTEAVHCDINKKKREFFAPSQSYVDTSGNKPLQRLKLEWVYGYRGRDVRQNLVVLPNTGEVVYFVAAVIVLYDRHTHTQKHYTGHTEEVTCLALHPTSPFIASGQLNGPSPEEAAHVRVWDALTLSTRAVIGLGHFSYGVASLSFCHGESDLLLAMEDGERHVMSVWEWKGQDVDAPCARTSTTNDPVVMGCFYPFKDKILISFGKQHLYFWKIFWSELDGKIMRDTKSGVFQADEVPSFITSICFTPESDVTPGERDVITGDSSGSVLVWSPDRDDVFHLDRDASDPMTYAHTKSVSSLVFLADGILLSGGGREIKAWNSNKRFELVIERELPDVYGTIRQLVAVTSSLEGLLLVGTSRDFILEGTLQSLFRPLVQGHSEEVWAVKAHPNEPSFFTAGHDAHVIKWSAREHRPVWNARDTKPCTSMAVDPRGILVAVGTTSGKVTLYGAKDGRERNSFQAGQAQVNALSFSPVEALGHVDLAVGCHDGFIYLYKVSEEGRVEGRKSAKARHSNMYVMHLDWSEDGRYLQTVLGDYDLVFWDLHNLMHTKAGRTMREVEWHSISAPVGYPLVGAWNWLDSGEVINVACRSGDQSCLLTGDSRGRLRLFLYPSIAAKPDFRQIKPFSSNTTATEFLCDDTGILTSGGNDAAVLQYALEYR